MGLTLIACEFTLGARTDFCHQEKSLLTSFQGLGDVSLVVLRNPSSAQVMTKIPSFQIFSLAWYLPLKCHQLSLRIAQRQPAQLYMAALLSVISMNNLRLFLTNEFWRKALGPGGEEKEYRHGREIMSIVPEKQEKVDLKWSLFHSLTKENLVSRSSNLCH